MEKRLLIFPFFVIIGTFLSAQKILPPDSIFKSSKTYLENMKFETDADTSTPSSNSFLIVDREPQPTNMNEIKKNIGYPPKALEKLIEGKVVVRILVDHLGNPTHWKIIRDPHEILTQSVTSQIENIKFTPGMLGGKRIKVWVTIPFDFKLVK